jgi:UDP-2,3-diacylglucosamine hydrolase
LSSAFIISDVHLTQMASPTGEALLSLIRKAQTEASLFVILGDLFDLWVGSGEAFQKEYQPLINELVKLRMKCPVYYFEGNHDFHLKRFWVDKMKFDIFLGPHEFEFGGLKIRAEHGDEINRRDYGYLFLRKFLRTLVLKFLIENVPSSLVSRIGQKASKVSREYTSGLKNQSVRILREYGLKMLKSRDFDLLVTGHTHIADDSEVLWKDKKVRFINLGSWFDGPHYLSVSSNGEIELLKI